jgi:hypothetical protein
MQPQALSPVLPILVAFAACLLLAPSHAVATEPLAAPTDLRCEGTIAPLGVDSPAPRFSWRLPAGAQTAYRILVASTPDVLASDHGDLWDSGRVESDDTRSIPYAGAPLASSQRAYWRVISWDQHGAASPPSAIAHWTMGVLKPGDWRASWITSPGALETVLLRHDFAVRPGLKRALVHVCGLGQYVMTINGAPVTEDLFTPGWTNYERTTLYDTHDITALLRPGANAAGITLGNGMYHVVRRNRFAKFTGSFGPLRAIAHLRLEYADGTIETVGTGESWRTHAGPWTVAQIYGGEDFDARLVPAGWDRPGFDDRAWLPAVPVIRLPDTLRGQSVAAEPIRVIETRPPVATRTFPDGTAVIDFGQNASFMPRFTVSGPAGGTVRLMPAEALKPDGTIERDTMGKVHRGYNWWQYTKATNEPESWFPQFFYLGSRYVRAEFIPADAGGPAPKLDAIEMAIIHADVDAVGSFACSNPLLNRIRELVRWAQRSNMVSILTDCPHREKLGWLEQAHLNGPSIRYEFDLSRLFAKTMHDMADAQTPEGLIPNIAPEYTEFKGTFRAAAEWGAAFIHVAWQQYQFTGDLDLFRTHYPAMKRYFAYLESRAEDGILSEGLGDWMDVGPKAPAKPQNTPEALTATAFYFADAQILSQAAALLGHDEDARTFAAKSEAIRQRFNAEFLHADTGSYSTGSQCANALPLVFGLVPPERRSAVLTSLVRDVESRGYAITTGGVGHRFLLEALAQGGRSDVVYRIINQDDKPGYGYQLKMGATALTEAWDANHGDSQNHFMMGHITEWFYRHLAGIDVDPAGPGFKKILIRPQPVGDLAWTEASYNSVHGTIAVRWERGAGGMFTLKTTIPPNTTATVHVPSLKALPRDEHGRAQAGVPVQVEDGYAVFHVGPGSHTFSDAP